MRVYASLSQMLDHGIRTTGHSEMFTEKLEDLGGLPGLLGPAGPAEPCLRLARERTRKEYVLSS